MKALFLIFGFAFFFVASSKGQIDTINSENLKLNIEAFKEEKSSFAVFWEDSLGNYTTSADIWERQIKFFIAFNGNKNYQFEWKWMRRDSLFATVTATGEIPSLRPISHRGDYVRRGKRFYNFNNNIVTVPDQDRHNQKDSSFRVVLNPPAFDFPMDLEIFPLLPFKKAGQQFAIAFYEPGTEKSDYYLLTVESKEKLQIIANLKVSCWVLRIDYDKNSYATFWIADKSREVVKMKEYSNGKYRYKVRLY